MECFVNYERYVCPCPRHCSASNLVLENWNFEIWQSLEIICISVPTSNSGGLVPDFSPVIYVPAQSDTKGRAPMQCLREKSSAVVLRCVGDTAWNVLAAVASSRHVTSFVAHLLTSSTTSTVSRASRAVTSSLPATRSTFYRTVGLSAATTGHGARRRQPSLTAKLTVNYDHL